MNAGCAGKTVRSLENAAIPERLGVFTTRRVIQIHVYLTLPCLTLNFDSGLLRIARTIFIISSDDYDDDYKRINVENVIIVHESRCLPRPYSQEVLTDKHSS